MSHGNIVFSLPHGGTVGFNQNRDIAALEHKNLSFVECTRYSCNISLIYLKVWYGPQTQFNHGVQCFTRHRRPKDEQIFHSYGSCVFQPCMRTGWLLETSPSDHYWRRYEVGQWLVFVWFWGWGTSDKQLARRKLGKKHTPQSWRPPLPYGHHGALSPAPPHTTISQHAVRQIYVIKTREYYCFY